MTVEPSYGCEGDRFRMTVEPSHGHERGKRNNIARKVFAFQVIQEVIFVSTFQMLLIIIRQVTCHSKNEKFIY